ncbi:MAG: glycosyltransferase family 2 protein [Acidobacteria bacterium]|nr:MAG: glycosyltransferase family 2 protein [Acidobacteriota bacterium]
MHAIQMRHTYALIIPARNESESIRSVLERVPHGLIFQVIVVDNGSVDRTAEVAAAAGAEVVSESARGYGRACMSGLLQVHPSVTAIAFMDADFSDNPEDLARMVICFNENQWDLVVGSRVLGSPELGSLTALQRFGNWLSTQLIAIVWHVQFTDLGPLRIIRRDSLARLNMRDITFGWTVEMQARAAQLGLRVCELPVSYRRRLHGQSKVSGTICGSLRAGIRILWTILWCCLFPLEASSPKG